MILFSWGLTSETEPAWKDAPLRSWRWTFQINRWAIGFFEQVKFPDRDWDDIRQFSICLRRDWRWRWRTEHTYYDGNHCTTNLGFVSICRDPIECQKCWPEESCDAN